MDTRLTYICHLVFNRAVREKVHDCLLPQMIDNQILRESYKLLRTYEQDIINPVVFIAELSKRVQLSQTDIQEINQCIMDSSYELSEENLSRAINTIFDYIRETRLDYILNNRLTGDLTASSAISSISELKDLTYSNSEYIDMSDMDQLIKMSKEDMPDESRIVKSSIGLINDVSAYHGYIPGDVVMICAAPGVGKSMLCCQEGAFALINGKKVVHYVLGDLTSFDIYTRYAARLTNNSISTIIADAGSGKLRNLSVFRNLKPKIAPPDTLSPEDIKSGIDELVKFKNFKPDMVIVDYDTNVLGDRDKMYQTGGILYNMMKSIAMEYKLVVLIASQPKVTYNEAELLGQSAAAESGRKQQVIDWMITLGRNQSCPTVGTLHIPKVRRGIPERSVRVKFDSSKACIRSISKQEYDKTVAEYVDTSLEQIAEDFQGLKLGVNDDA